MTTLHFAKGPGEKAEPAGLIIRLDADDEINTTLIGDADNSAFAVVKLISKAINGLGADELRELLADRVADVPDDIGEMHKFRKQRRKARRERAEKPEKSRADGEAK